MAEGLVFKALSPTEVVQLEPALEPLRDQLAGALHCRMDESGDARRFCEALAAEAHRKGVEFRFGVDITALNIHSNRMVAAVSQNEVFVGDQYIIAAGSYSSPLLRSVGVYAPVQPVKGYSITINEFRDRHHLGIPVIDDDLHAVVTPLETMIRVAGTAEFVGFDRTLTPARILNLIKLLKAILPELEYDPAAMKEWCGLRPVCSDGVPIIGRTPVPNLLVNTGHGHLGWTMAAGSAHLLTEIISGSSPRIDPAPYSLARFGVFS
jgi:D-amino-acid dehydrogenase